MDRNGAVDVVNFDDDEFFEALICWVKSKYGMTPTWIEIAVAEHDRVISKPVRLRGDVQPLQRGGRPAPPRLTKDQAEARDLILAKLADLGCRLTTRQLLAALEKDGKVVSLSFLQHLLPRMVKAGQLSEPDEDGYGLVN